ncbi:hypothetical protein WA158_003082 [Blastocystis sp. Blastoise]
MVATTTIKGLFTLLGALIIHITLGTLYSISNMNSYVISYLHVIRQVDIDDSYAVWVFAGAAFGQASIMMVGGIIDSKIGSRWTAFIGGFICALSNILCYWAVDSYIAVVLIFGLLFGWGVGLAYSPCLSAGMKWFPKHAGLISGVVVAGFGCGALIFNIVQTKLVNPDNLPTIPDVATNKSYFPYEVCERVPMAFIWLGCIYFVMIVAASLMISTPTDEEDKLIHESSEALIDTNIKEGLAPKDIVKVWKFWEIYLTFFMNGLVVVFISSFYKFIANDFTNDDLFSSLVGSISSLCNGLSRPIWGYLSDKFGYKKVMCCICFGVAFFTGTLILSEQGGKYLFFIWVCLLYFTIGGNFALFPAYTSRSFGTLYMSTNYGWIFTNQIFSSLISAFAAPILVKKLGYNNIVIGIGCIMCVSFIMNILTKPWTYKQHPKFNLPTVVPTETTTETSAPSTESDKPAPEKAVEVSTN